MDNEQDIYNRWKKTQSVEDFQSLYKMMKPQLERAAYKASKGSTIPASAHKVYAAQSFLDALRTYKPMAGSLQTHVYGSVMKKSNRLNYEFQDLGAKAENRSTKVGTYQAEYANLYNELGREPSTAELADRIGMGVRDIARLQKELHANLSLNDGLGEEVGAPEDVDEEVLSYLYYELSNEEKVVYEYMFGRNGKPQLVKQNNKIDYNAIANRTNVSSSKVRRLVHVIAKKLDKRLKGM